MLNYQLNDKGESKTMVLITGAGMSSWMWAYQEELPYNLLTFDLPGHGKNAYLEFESIAQTVQQLIEILNHENIDSCSFMGHSIGGQIVLYMMMHHHKRMDHAYIISGLNQPSAMMKYLVKPMIKLSMPLLKWRWFAKMQANQLSIPEAMFDSYFEDAKYLTSKTLINLLLENQNFEFSGTNLEGRFVTLIVGKKEVRSMRQSMLKNHYLIKNSKYIELDAGHDIPYAFSQQLNDIIKKSTE